MADTNQLSTTELVQEVRDKLQLYTDNLLKADSALPPQNKVVFEAIKTLQNALENLETKFNDKISETNEKSIYKAISNLELNLSAIDDSNFNLLQDALEREVGRSKEAENKLADRIKYREEQLDTFLHAAEIGEATIDTLKEIQKWITEDETGTSALVNRVSILEEDVILISCGNSDI